MTMIVENGADEGETTCVKKEPTRDWGWHTKDTPTHFLPPKVEIKVANKSFYKAPFRIAIGK